MVSGINREQSARDAGATSFLHYGEWLRIGSMVEAHLAQLTQGESAEGEGERAA